MNRMNRYEENSENSEQVISRELKNQDMYKDVYLNNTLVDFNEINPNAIKETVVEEEIVTTYYEEKNYNINDYLKKAHENRVNDNLNRSLDNTDCEVNKIQEKEDEISKLIESIEKKEKEEELFSDLMPDDENTIITDPIEEPKLENVIDEEALFNYAMSNPDKKEEEEEFKDIVENKSRSKSKKLPLIIFITTLILLIALVVYIVVFK